MMLDWVRTVAPAGSVVTVAEAKAQARITHVTEDGLIADYIRAAESAAEAYMGRGVLTQTWVVELTDWWAGRLFLPMAAPLQSVSTVKYYDTAGTQQTLSSSAYLVNTVTEPGSISRAPDQVWPSLQADRLARIEITYVVGWTSAATVPSLIKHGVRLYTAYLCLDREGVADIPSIGNKSAADAAKDAAEAFWARAGRIWWRPACAVAS